VGFAVNLHGAIFAAEAAPRSLSPSGETGLRCSLDRTARKFGRDCHLWKRHIAAI